MPPTEAITQTIQITIAPVVMITACAIILNGLIVRYNTLGDRLRAVSRDLRMLQDGERESASNAERMHDFEYLLSDLLRHHHLAHDALVLIYISILIFMIDMLVIAIAISIHVTWLAQLVWIVFLIGVGVLFWGMVIIAHELRTSHHSVQFEVHRNCRLCHSQTSKPNLKQYPLDK
jgi:hypothetical protein